MHSQQSDVARAMGPVTVWQHLLITELMPETSDKLESTERNLAGQSLLPNLRPYDWPSVQRIAEAQALIHEQARGALRSVETASAGVSLLVNAEGLIVLPRDDLVLIAIICAAAHQGHHGHVKADEMYKRIRECFFWKGLRKDVATWSKRCLQCIKLEGGDTIPRPMGYQLRATRPMEVTVLNYMDMPNSHKQWGFKAVLHGAYYCGPVDAYLCMCTDAG